MTVRRDLTPYPGFWHTYAVACWQPEEASGKDPDTESPATGDTDDETNATSIYIETLREEELPGRPRHDEGKTIAHEIGHAGGSPADHTDHGLMEKGATGDHFKPITIRRFRANSGF
jgi:hypothetical protein